MAISAVLFDLDETLIVEEESNRAAFAEVCDIAYRQHGIDPDELARAVRSRAAELWRASAAFEYCLAIGISSWEGLWGPFTGSHPQLQALAEFAPSYRIAAWNAALEDARIRDRRLAETLAASFVESRARRHVVFEETIPTLIELRRSFSMAIVTNGAPAIQRIKIAGAELGGHFGGILVSGEVGYGKPDERIFRAALEQLDIKPDEAVMVGDNLKRDVGGAQTLGIKAVWINRNGRAPREGSPTPDAEIHSLEQLGTAIEWVAAAP